MEPTLEETPDQSPFQFSIRTLLWAITLLGVGMGTFGPWLGMYLAFLAIACNLIVSASRSKHKKSVPLIVVIILGTHLLIAFLMPAVGSARSAALRNQSLNRMKQSCLAMLNYQATNGEFPGPYSVDLDKNPLHSWRTLLLPFLEEHSPYESLDLSVPWNEGENRGLLSRYENRLLRSPRLPSRNEGMGVTNYLAIVDEETVWKPTGAVSLEDITDGASNTIVLIEVLGKEIPWYEPRDLTLEEAIDILVGEVDIEWVGPGFFVSPKFKGDGLGYRVVGFADGSTRPIHRIANREIARAWLTRSGGEKLPEDWRKNYSTKKPAVVGHVIHWGHIGCTLLFIALALLPLWQQKSRRDDSE